MDDQGKTIGFLYHPKALILILYLFLIFIINLLILCFHIFDP
jgi:hypothetical protein